MDKYNVLHYPDPTAAEALGNVEREEKAKNYRHCVFICSPYAGDIKTNVDKAKRYLRFAVDKGAIPFAPHLLYPQVMDDHDPDERKLGLFWAWYGLENVMRYGCLEVIFQAGCGQKSIRQRSSILPSDTSPKTARR